MRDESLRNELFEAEAKLNKILDNETSGIITRARAKWTEQGERSNKYFFSLEKSNSKKKNICKLINESKVELYEQDEISKHVVDFYRNLFRAKDNNINNMKEYINSCEAKILDVRMAKALDEEFSYNTLNVIKNILLRSLPHIISNVQSGFQAGRSTSDNLILMYLTLEHYYNNPQEECLLLQLDLEKAFDSVKHAFMYETFKFFGFGENLIRLVKVAFHGCMSYANVNGHLSDTIYISRGLHQGSPLSPILFLIVAQILTCKLNSNQDVKGIYINSVEILLSIFADDTDIFLHASIECLEAVLSELAVFGDHSGCKCNVDKTKCIPLGKTKSNVTLLNRIKDKNYSPDFIQDTFVALGINFSNNMSIYQIMEVNYEAKITKAKSWVNIWNRRDLTVLGKVTIIKSLIYSQFSYLAIPLIKPPKSLIKSIDTLTFHFLWGCKRDKIKREVIIKRQVVEGGLGLFDFSEFLTSLKITVIKKIIDPNFDHHWKQIFISQLRFPNLIEISIENTLSDKKYGIVRDILLRYSEWKEAAAAARGGCANHVIWNNNKIIDLSSTMWNYPLISRGILYISDFLGEDNSLTSYGNFCERWNLYTDQISSKTYVDIKMAIRSFNCPSVKNRDISRMNIDICLSYFKNRKGEV